MQKKKVPQILFTNDTYLESTTQRGNRGRCNRISSNSIKKIRTFDFAYSFNDYLKLALAKILPKYDTITFIPSKTTIIGEDGICQELITKTLKEFASHKFIILYKKSPSDIDQLDFWLDEEVNIYRPEVIQIGLKQLQKMKLDTFKDNIEGVRQSMAKGMFLMRLPKEKEAQIREKMDKIIKEASLANSFNKTEVNTEPEEAEVTFFEQDDSRLEQPQFYFTPERYAKQPIKPVQEDSCSIDLNSILESSVAITETDHQESSCIYTTGKKKKMDDNEFDVVEAFEMILPNDLKSPLL